MAVTINNCIGQLAFSNAEQNQETFMHLIKENLNFANNQDISFEIGSYKQNDRYIYLPGEGISLDTNTTYFLRGNFSNNTDTITRMNSSDTLNQNVKISVYLVYIDNEEVQYYQRIGNNRTSYYTGSIFQGFVFTPEENFNYIVFQLTSANDYFSSIVISVSDLELYSIKNQFNNISAKRIGVQAPANTPVVINRELMRVGKSQILEIDNGININFFGLPFKVESNGIPGTPACRDVIVDYVYATS